MHKVEKISVKEYLDLKKKEKVRLVDIRTPHEHKRECIDCAENILVEDIYDANIDSDEVVVLHCQSGNRTNQAAEKVAGLTAKKIYLLDGGINAWKQHKQPTQKNVKEPLPIMRQVQIIVGFMVLLGVVLSFTVSQYFAILSGFFGAGLLFAGLSGTCGLAIMLEFLPYNKRK
ncbi:MULTISPECIES: rhodanese-like domain-containing protein [unclassified Francisella]|uniref:rhodanese-like domain-containing protein n=1 Tax=unclassified Francisella TaxID=2610885 RepID=UPI002E350608|nr:MULTISPECIES: rhodanese family protein [unclassified Francisella]MED7818535.1 rhodanese family protein [Francisella sp. 19S2-4]MED7829371.1 rhodanese family protein [Francisella sp. 19S2-10]